MTPERWKQIEELYFAAMDQEADERSALLDKASPDVRDIVRGMLTRKTHSLLDLPVAELRTETQVSSSWLTVGSTLGHYQIEEAVGAGGMGEVYRAMDTRLARKVAIKAIRTSRFSERLELRFLEEARAASALNHPNIITIYDIGAMDGLPYIVMEWIDGQTLRRKLANGPLATPELFMIASQIADALGAAHDGGILHRDLKPENIMVTTEGRVKVLDFGVAKRVAVPDAATADLSLTMPGSIIGTPGYMSPEQARGEELDFRSDHFSFGALLYEMATGRMAFSGNGAAEVQAAILLKQPEPLTLRNPEVPAPLQWFVERCLAKSPRDRFGSTAELRRELSAIMSGAHRVATFPPINNLPEPRTALIGREDELTNLRMLTADPDLHMLTLAGPGGIGKTRLAIELARQIAGNFAGGVCFVPLDKVSQVSLVPSEVTRGMGITLLAGQNEEAAIAEHMRHMAGPVLLVLDNFEHVLDAAPFVARVSSDRLMVIVTSRAPLRVYGEYEFPVPSLCSDGCEGEAMPISPAVRLFLERAPGLRGSSREIEQIRIVSEICQRLDGLPLAIELAAARTKLLPLKTLLARLDEPLGVLVGGARDLPQRQHTLRATLDWSYNLLDAQHQKLFRRMSVFVGGATIEAIEAVCDTQQDLQVNLWNAVELLVDNSLIRHMTTDDEEPRFAMLETMREYGMERLAAAGEDAYTRKAHAAYCLVLVEETSSLLRREHTGRHRFDAELGNLRAAVDWLTSAGEVEWGLRLMMAIALFFVSRRLHTEGVNRLSRLLALPGVERFPRLRNWGRYWETDLAFEGLDTPPTDRYLEYFKIFEAANDREGMMQVASRLGLNLKSTDLTGARKWGERAVEMGRSGFPPIILAGLLSNLADVIREGEFTRARSLYREAMRLFEESDDRENAIWALSHEADLHREHGHGTQARSLYLEALGKFRALGFSLGVASCLYDLAGLEVAEGKLAKAEGMYSECLRLYGAENVPELPRVLESLAFVKIRGAEPGHALTLAGAATAIREHFFARAVSARRSELEQKVEAARKELGADATLHWMKGWNMSPQEIIDWATKSGEQQWTTSPKQ